MRVLLLLSLAIPLAALHAGAPAPSRAAEPPLLTADFSHPEGTLRPLHGINKGPLAPGGLLDVTAPVKELAPPFIRLHDCHWPNPDVVDIHAIFPNPQADPEREESYDFRLTDEYLEACRATGAQVIYRLGESIEHTRTKRFVHPPTDPARWAAVALGIIRHYNEGWAHGFRYGIRYWEIWNEPDNRPSCWTGGDEEYFRLYQTAARAIKARYPELKVGGPAVGNTGELKGEALRPSPFVQAFLRFCRDERAPLDFFSWHCYTDQPAELAARARAVRKLLDESGFPRAESHLTEWNYLPGGNWDGVLRTAAPQARQEYYARMAGAPGAAFLVAALLQLQDAPVDVCALFHGEVGGFGLFSEHGIPEKNYYALSAFRQLLTMPKRVAVRGAAPGVTAAAGVDAEGKRAAVLLSRAGAGEVEVRLSLRGEPWRGGTSYEVRKVDAEHHLAATEPSSILPSTGLVTLRLKGPCVALVELGSISQP